MIPNFNKSYMDFIRSSSSDMTAFKSKAGAMSFAILMSTTYCEGGKRSVDYDEAQKLYDFITKNVVLPDVVKNSYSEMVEALAGLAKANAARTTAE